MEPTASKGDLGAPKDDMERSLVVPPANHDEHQAASATATSPSQSVKHMSTENAQEEIYRLARLHGLNLSILAENQVGRSIKRRTSQPLATIPPRTNLSFFYLPLEIRHEIYKLLLVNPALGKSPKASKADEWVKDHETFCKTKYGLAPVILRVSKQLHAEALGYLYNGNTLLVQCREDDPFRVHGEDYDAYISPLMRSAEHVSFRYHPAIAKIRNWAVIVPFSTFNNGPLDDFCRSIARSRPRSLEVIIEDVPTHTSYSAFTKLLAPLNMLSGIEHASIQVHYEDDSHVVIFALKESTFVKQLISTMTSQSTQPKELVFEMYGPLLRYIRAFERKHKFAFNSNFGLGENHLNLTTAEFSDAVDMHLWLDLPLECLVASADWAQLGNNILSFKRNRALAILDLEPQYKRIIAAWSNLRRVLNYHAPHSPWLVAPPVQNSGVNTITDTALLEDVLEVVAECVEAFEREFPEDNRAKWKEGRLEEEILSKEVRDLCRLRRAVGLVCKEVEEEGDGDEPYTLVKRAAYSLFPPMIQNLERLYSEISEARKALFKFDLLGDPKCDIELEPEGLKETLSERMKACRCYELEGGIEDTLSEEDKLEYCGCYEYEEPLDNQQAC